MPNVVKYEVGGSETNSIKKGNLWFGVGGRGYGPTDVTGFYSGISIPDGGYGFYQGSAGGFTYYTANNDDQLVALVNSATGNSFDISESLHYIAQQDGMAVMKKNENQTITDGLVFNTDASSLLSYPTTESKWYDLSRNDNIFSLLNTIDFNSSGYLSTDGTDGYLNGVGIQSVSNISGSDPFSFSTLFKLTQYANQRDTNPANYTALLMKGSYNPSFGITLCYDLPSEGVHTRARLYTGGRNLSLPSDSSGYGILDMFGYKEFELNKWYRADLTIESSDTSYTMKTYVNGEIDRQLIKTNALYPIKFENDSNLTCGSSTPLGGNGIFAPINLAEAQIYNKVLSQAEILQNYYGGPIVTGSLDLVYDAGNLVSYESGSSTTYPMTGSITGSLVNGAGFSSDGGGSFDFDGTDDAIDLDYSNVMYNTSTMTLECWIKSSDDGAGSEDWCTFMGTRYGNSIQIGRYSSSNKCGVLLATSTGGNLNLASGTTPIFDEKWHHCVVTFDNGVCKFYVDTNLEVTDSSRSGQTLTTSNSDKFGIGGSSGGGDGRNFYGKTTSCKIYSKALTADEVWQNYLAQLVRFE